MRKLMSLSVCFTAHLLYYCSINVVGIHSPIYKVNLLSCCRYANKLQQNRFHLEVTQIKEYLFKGNQVCE